jgi:glyoxylase-like metal-dependent hydrolase (beta-lactamase superfamily II)
LPAAAEPQPAGLPLPGGSPDATVRLRPMTTGTMHYARDGLLQRDGKSSRVRALRAMAPGAETLEIPVPFFLVEHPTAGSLLVDTGLHASVAVDPKSNLGRVFNSFARIEMGDRDSAPDQLRAAGVDPASVRHVVMTHLHADHASGVAQFPGATFLVDGREWEFATQPRTLEYVARQFDHAFDWRLLDFSSESVNSFATFGRSLDLFGDGSVRLVSTPGHTPGHLSVVVRLREREALLTADAAYTMRSIRESEDIPFTMSDEHQLRRSLREVQLFVKETPDALVVPGHDLELFRSLDAVYE